MMPLQTINNRVCSLSGSRPSGLGIVLVRTTGESQVSSVTPQGAKATDVEHVA